MDTLGVVESKSIAAGVALADGLVKAAGVTLLKAATICAGRYLILVGGDTEAVETAVAYARDSSYSLTGSFVITNISPQITAVLKNGRPAEHGEAHGGVEGRNGASGLAAADRAVKKSAVRLLRLVAGQGIMGKSYFVVGGDVASVTEAVEAATGFLAENLIQAVILPVPDESVVTALTGRHKAGPLAGQEH